MLMHVIAHGGHKSLYRKLALGEKSLVSVTLGIEPASVVFLSFQSDALPPSAHSKKWSFWRMVFFSATFFFFSLSLSLFFSFFLFFFFLSFFTCLTKCEFCQHSVVLLTISVSCVFVNTFLKTLPNYLVIPF